MARLRDVSTKHIAEFEKCVKLRWRRQKNFMPRGGLRRARVARDVVVTDSERIKHQGLMCEGSCSTREVSRETTRPKTYLSRIKTRVSLSLTQLSRGELGQSLCLSIKLVANLGT